MKFLDSQTSDFIYIVENKLGFDAEDFINGLNWAILDAKLEPLREVYAQELARKELKQ